MNDMNHERQLWESELARKERDGQRALGAHLFDAISRAKDAQGSTTAGLDDATLRAIGLTRVHSDANPVPTASNTGGTAGDTVRSEGERGPTPVGTASGKGGTPTGTRGTPRPTPDEPLELMVSR